VTRADHRKGGVKKIQATPEDHDRRGLWRESQADLSGGAAKSSPEQLLVTQAYGEASEMTACANGLGLPIGLLQLSSSALEGSNMMLSGKRYVYLMQLVAGEKTFSQRVVVGR